MRIMITGIAGTLGSAFVEFLHDKHDVHGVDRNETSVAELKRKYPISVELNDFDNVSLGGFDLLIHLAAMKHVDLCESNPNSCVMNNVMRTQALFGEAAANHTDIIFMSTDKAVEPCSVYGYTKALGEHMAWEYGGTVVRSGNILASNGSILSIWDEAIKDTLPLKITHRDMVRYFINVDNLVQQIWEKYLEGERLIIPKMDEEVKLIDLARNKLRDHGYDLETYPGGIEYTGLRPGEKLKEKLRW